MVSSENRTGLYVTVPVYFSLLALVAFWAYKRTQAQKTDGVNDQLSAHYLGGKSFGPLLTAGTLFASLFSGYTIVGIPNEAYYIGFRSIHWLPTFMGIVAGYFGTGVRLRKVGLVRNHQSPTDFITDRFQSHSVRYLLVLLQFLPTTIYLAAQVLSIKGTFNSIFELDADNNYPVILIMILILIFEWLGGLNSVALTDAIQALVMIISFLALPSVIMRNFGGWQDLDPETYPRPDFFQTMPKESQWGSWQFVLVNFSLFTLPHLIQRIYAAKDLASLRFGFTVMTIGPWFTGFVGLFIGTMGVQILSNNGAPTFPADPFAAVVEKVMDLGGFSLAVGVIAITASLAAIMSTADSLIIANSQLITEEIVYPLRPNSTQTQVALVGKAVSLITVALAVVVGISWEDGIADLGAVQFASSFQALPAFLIGLFATKRSTDVHPYSIVAAGFSGIIVVFAVHFGYILDNPDALSFNAAYQGMVTQIGILILAESYFRLTSDKKEEEKLGDPDYPFLMFPDRPSWDIPNTAKYGEHALTPEFIWKSMEGVHEPLANPWWCFLMFLVLTLGTSFAPESQPPFAAPGGSSRFTSPPAVVNGVPWWAFRSFLFSGLATMLLLGALWNMPSEYPGEDKPTEKIPAPSEEDATPSSEEKSLAEKDHEDGD